MQRQGARHSAHQCMYLKKEQPLKRGLKSHGGLSDLKHPFIIGSAT